MIFYLADERDAGIIERKKMGDSKFNQELFATESIKEVLKLLGIPAKEEIIQVFSSSMEEAVNQGFYRDDVIRYWKAMRAGTVENLKIYPQLHPILQKCKEVLDSAKNLMDIREEPVPWKSWAVEDTEDKAIQQISDSCRLPISVGGALMPDAHSGYGLPIGGVLATKNAVIPYAVGVDIACRMHMTVLDIPYRELLTNEKRFIQAIEEETRFGVAAQYTGDEIRHHPVMDEDWDFCEIVKRVKRKAAKQLGTSGAGNHFVEFGKLVVPEDINEPQLTLKAGEYLALLSHSGSRGPGNEVATYFSQLAQKLHPFLPDKFKHLAWLDLDSKEGQDYWKAMELMGRYASVNHALIHENIVRNLKAKVLASLENHHNFAWKEVFNGEELIIHRKGATPAGKGVLGIVPGSMATPGFIVRGKGNPDSFNSCSHGAGRLMSRTAAFRQLTESNLKKLLEERGVHLISGSLDESPEVYKNIESVMAQQKDLVDVLARFEPRLVKMAPRSSDRADRRYEERRNRRRNKREDQEVCL